MVEEYNEAPDANRDLLHNHIDPVGACKRNRIEEHFSEARLAKDGLPRFKRL